MTLIGTWVLTLARVEPGNTATFEIHSHDATVSYEPWYTTDECGISFTYADGRRAIYPWANLLCADYKPA